MKLGIIAKTFFITGFSIYIFTGIANAKQSKVDRNSAGPIVITNSEIFDNEIFPRDFVRIQATDKSVEICMSTSVNHRNRKIMKIKKLMNPKVDITNSIPLPDIEGLDLLNIENRLTGNLEEKSELVTNTAVPTYSFGELIQESVSARSQNKSCSLYGIFVEKNDREIDDNKEIFKVFNTCHFNDPYEITEDAYNYHSFVDAMCE